MVAFLLLIPFILILIFGVFLGVAILRILFGVLGVVLNPVFIWIVVIIIALYILKKPIKEIIKTFK